MTFFFFFLLSYFEYCSFSLLSRTNFFIFLLLLNISLFANTFLRINIIRSIFFVYMWTWWAWISVWTIYLVVQEDPTLFERTDSGTRWTHHGRDGQEDQKIKELHSLSSSSLVKSRKLLFNYFSSPLRSQSRSKIDTTKIVFKPQKEKSSETYDLPIKR